MFLYRTVVKVRQQQTEPSRIHTQMATDGEETTTWWCQHLLNQWVININKFSLKCLTKLKVVFLVLEMQCKFIFCTFISVKVIKTNLWPNENLTQVLSPCRCINGNQTWKELIQMSALWQIIDIKKAFW